MILAVPAVTPVTMPVEPTVAMPVLPLVHVPPPGVPVSAVVEAAHTVSVPVMVGVVFTVTVVVAAQPVLGTV